MPKEAFFKLKLKKREKIILAARAEFSKYKYDDVSINDIVKGAGISRGSFYLYFEDKWDVYSHLLNCTFSKVRERTRDTFSRGNNIFFTILDVYDYIVLENATEESNGFIANILGDITPLSYLKIYNLIDISEDKEFSNKYCYQSENFVIQTEIEFEVMKKTLFLALTSAFTRVLVMKEDPQKVREELRIVCNMFKYGVFK